MNLRLEPIFPYIEDAEQAGDGNAVESVRLNLELSTGVAIPYRSTNLYDTHSLH